MKSYKLIKQYPGCPKVGTVLTPKTEIKNPNTNNFYWEGSWFNPNDFSEFWEEVVEKGYEILSQTPSIRVCDRINDCYVVRNTAPEILSVKRLSDGEIFSVGDKVKVGGSGTLETIDGIDLFAKSSSWKEGIWLNYSAGWSHIDYATKQEKQPVSLTYDGKNIFIGDTVWYVNKNITTPSASFTASPIITFRLDINAYFLTKEEAEDYIIENKPAISIKEFWEITAMSGSNRVKSIILEELVKKRL